MVRIVELLILGGTVFLGRHVVDAALAAGHRVTILHRGTSPAHRPADVEELLADRDGGLDVLAGRSWDAVVDTSGYVPRVVGDSARRLAGVVDHYVFVSSVSVYADLTRGVDEDRSVHEPPGHEDVAAAYGGLKVGCERAVEAALPGRALHVRAGLLVGPHDGTNRFTYWVTRVAAGGEVLVPDALDHPAQVVDVRDLAGWIVVAAEDRLTGTLNVMGPRGAVTFGGLLAAARAAGGSDARLTVVDEDWLLAQGVAPWEELPLWLPASMPAYGGMLDGDDRCARDMGVRFRPIAQTVADTLAWARTAPPARGLTIGARVAAAGISRDREAELLAAWHART